jgi:hypothetical protein
MIENRRHNKITFAYVCKIGMQAIFSSLWLAVLVFLESPKRIIKRISTGSFREECVWCY